MRKKVVMIILTELKMHENNIINERICVCKREAKERERVGRGSQSCLFI
jgi:hypothetical protein